MRRYSALAPVVAVLMAALAMPAAAQSSAAQPREFGIDGAITFGLDDPRVTTIAIPFQQVRVGFFTSPKLSIEPMFSLSRQSQEDGPSLTTLGLGVGALYHLSTVRTEKQWYVRPFADLQYISIDLGAGGGSNSDSQFGLGAGFGLKVPVADRFATRYELTLAHHLESGNLAASTTLGLMFGLSYFTR